MTQINLDKDRGRQLTEQELDALYLYLDMYIDAMDRDEKVFWTEVLKNIDSEFYDDTSDGADDVRPVQSLEGSA